ncbi:adenylate kinase 8 [Xiphophorus couchianus]|uniref:adenylate kinase 8 n=1 Tax=Xiphophorus couchianus TaxID=32473 RepID=UPI001015F972|nr:adenylate kinase 8 [Xiphophorus couchianus]XP_027873236.1 adenylate kinase 8 [Xiphophorus couchianus]
MDETLKPLRIPPQISVYADKHNVSHLVESMVTSLVMEQPDDPISYLITFLQRLSLDNPRVLLLGPPAVGKHMLAKTLSNELRAVHLTSENLLKGLSEEEDSSEVLVQQLQQRLKETDCFHKGWVLVGIPQTRVQVLQLQRAGIIPEHVVMLDAPEEVLLQRNHGKLTDPVTGDVYHQLFVQPENDTIRRRLERGRGLSEEQLLAEVQRFRCEVTALKSAYQHVLKVFNADQPPADVYQQALTFVRTRRHFRTPRIVLVGPSGSGKSHLARLLSEKYKLVDVSCGGLLRSVVSDGSALGAQIQLYMDVGRPVPDSLLMPVLEARLSRVDCSCRGWILHGFPCDMQQAKSLHESQYQPNRVFFLEASDDVCMQRLSLRGTDPVSGERYHAVTQPAPSSEVQDRLRTAPYDGSGALTQRLRRFRLNYEGLQTMYPDALHLDADQDPHTVLESLESRLYTN